MGIPLFCKVWVLMWVGVSLSQEEVELPLLPEFSTAEKLLLPPSPSLLQVAGERLKSRPLRNSMLELVGTVT